MSLIFLLPLAVNFIEASLSEPYTSELNTGFPLSLLVYGESETLIGAYRVCTFTSDTRNNKRTCQHKNNISQV